MFIFGFVAMKWKSKKQSDGSQDEPIMVGNDTYTPPTKKPINKRFLIYAAVLAVLGIGAVVLYKHNTGSVVDKLSPDACVKNYTKSCAIAEAKPLLDGSSNYDKLSKVVDKVKKINGYENDPDLLYIVTIYYINIGDGKNAQSYYDMLSKVYNSKAGFSKSFGTLKVQYSDMKGIIDYLNRALPMQLKNTQGGSI